jgi:SAM-dependent methyltransferase
LIRNQVGKPSDTLLSDDPAADVETPPPVAVPVEVEAAQERSSGSISISGGDFATPMVRKRTTTKPRGLPVVAAPVDLAADVVTPPPRHNGAPAPERKAAPRKSAAAMPARVPETTLVREPLRDPAREEGPATLHSEAARLRDAERAPSKVETPAPPEVAGGLTPVVIPLPAAVMVAPTPVPLASPALGVAAPAAEPAKLGDEVAVHVEVDMDPGPTPPPQTVARAEPQPELDAEPMLVSEPELEPEPTAESEASSPPAVAVAASAAPIELDEMAVPDEMPAKDHGAIPSRAMHDLDSGRNLSPLAQTLAHIAEEAQRRSDGVVAVPEELNAEDDLELVDAPLDAAPAIPALRASAPPLPVLPAIALATPPPIPAILAKGSIGSAPPEPASGADARAGFATPLPEALAERPRRPKRSKPWFEEIFDEDYLRTLPFMTAQQTMKEVSFIEASLEAPAGAEVLDVGCGYGRHAIELVQRGLNVTGLDLSLPLLIRAADEAQRRALSVNFVHADMREMPFDRKFDGAYSMLTSFGYFDEDANLKVAEGVARALKPGGRFLLDIVNRDYVVADLPSRIWWEGTGCVVLEEVDFNFHTSRVVTRRSVVFEDGRQLEQEISVRAYSLHELGRLLRHAGFRVLDISGSLSTRGRFLGVNSRNLLVLSEKRTD